MRGAVLVSIGAFCLRAWVEAAIVEYTWNVTYVDVSPDGYERTVIGINNHWPCPKIEANVGDTIRINLENGLPDQTTGIHFHGINQLGTPWMDGSSGVTQCPIPPGSRITYEFFLDEAGTYWYHSHDMGQYPDGLRGPMIVHDRENDPWKGKYDDEFVITITDWYHDNSINLARGMLVPNNTLHQPPLLLEGPDSMLVNEGGDVDVNVEVGKTYRFRFINMAAIAAYFIYFDSFNVRVIMTDASYVKEQVVSQIRIATAQRYDVLVTIEEKHKGYNWPWLMAQDFHKNYRIDVDPPGVWPKMFNKYNVSGYMILDPEYPRLEQQPLMKLDPFEEMDFSPLDDEAPWGPVTKEVILNFAPVFDVDGIPVMPFNGDVYVPQIVPTLYTASSVGEANINASVYGQVNPVIVDIGDVVQIVINNNDTGIHPYHLHGHQFQLLLRAGVNAGIWETGGPTGSGVAPPKRDTLNIEPLSYAVLRIKITDPGVFLLHCHLEWHVIMGLTMTIIQGPQHLRDAKIPQDHLDACAAAGIPTKGNSIGITSDPFNLTGAPTVLYKPYQGASWPRHIGG